MDANVWVHLSLSSIYFWSIHRLLNLHFIIRLDEQTPRAFPAIFQRYRQDSFGRSVVEDWQIQWHSRNSKGEHLSSSIQSVYEWFAAIEPDRWHHVSMGALDRPAAISGVRFDECAQLWVSPWGRKDHISLSLAALEPQGHGGALLDVSRGMRRSHHQPRKHLADRGKKSKESLI